MKPPRNNPFGSKFFGFGNFHLQEDTPIREDMQIALTRIWHEVLEENRDHIFFPFLHYGFPQNDKLRYEYQSRRPAGKVPSACEDVVPIHLESAHFANTVTALFHATLALQGHANPAIHAWLFDERAQIPLPSHEQLKQLVLRPFTMIQERIRKKNLTRIPKTRIWNVKAFPFLAGNLQCVGQYGNGEFWVPPMQSTVKGISIFTWGVIPHARSSFSLPVFYVLPHTHELAEHHIWSTIQNHYGRNPYWPYPSMELRTYIGVTPLSKPTQFYPMLKVGPIQIQPISRVVLPSTGTARTIILNTNQPDPTAQMQKGLVEAIQMPEVPVVDPHQASISWQPLITRRTDQLIPENRFSATAIAAELYRWIHNPTPNTSTRPLPIEPEGEELLRQATPARLYEAVYNLKDQLGEHCILNLLRKTHFDWDAKMNEIFYTGIEYNVRHQLLLLIHSLWVGYKSNIIPKAVPGREATKEEILANLEGEDSPSAVDPTQPRYPHQEPRQ